ncbi:MAG: 3-dehydroquinate synthase [Solirubrobacterales bacterium]
MRELEIKLKDKEYKIFIKRNISKEIGEFLKINYKAKKVAVITDHNLNNIYGSEFEKLIAENGFETKIISVKPGEESKSLETLKVVYEELSKFKLTREDLILAFGGGVVGDLAGFAASTYLRGIPYIQVPTSLLAQVDSSIGGKVAVDLPWGKNLVGSFYHPEVVFIDPELLRTLEKKFFHDGLAEVIKYGCIKDESIVKDLMKFKSDDELLDNIDLIIYKCCSIKKSLVEMDERDFGDRMLLNFGHTLGHVVEKYFNYNKYTHGEAVAIGMVHITRNTEKLGLTEEGTAKRIEDILKKFGLPYNTPEMEKGAAQDTVLLDKKSSGSKISLALITSIGNGFIKKIEINDLKDYI